MEEADETEFSLQSAQKRLVAVWAYPQIHPDAPQVLMLTSSLFVFGRDREGNPFTYVFLSFGIKVIQF